jgi:thioredoxin reductase
VKQRKIDVAIIGGGPAGLTAATRLSELGVDRVVVLEREQVAGGIPRHCGHPTFGLRDFKRLMTGPKYARRLVQRTHAAGSEISSLTTVLEIGRDNEPFVVSTSPSGLIRWDAGAVVLASGCRERPRMARLIPGTRAAGVYTTGELQQFTYLQHKRVGERAVVLGAEHVSFSAVMTLHHAGLEVAAMITPSSKHETYGPLRVFATRFRSVPMLVGHRLVEILGKGRVEGVIVEDRERRRHRIACDTVIVTGDWVAEGSLAVAAGLSSDVRNGGRPEVNSLGETALDGVFSAGSVVRPGESSSRAAQAGILVAQSVNTYLHGDLHRLEAGLRFSFNSPIRWVSPQRLRPGHSGPVYLRVDRRIEPAVVIARDAGRVVDSMKFGRMIPGRTYALAHSWCRDASKTAALELELSIEDPT